MGFCTHALLYTCLEETWVLAELMFPSLKKPICKKRLGVPIGAPRRFCVVMIGRRYVAVMTVFMLLRLTSTANGSRRRQGGVLRNSPSDCRRQTLLRQPICRFGSGVQPIPDLCQRDQRAHAANCCSRVQRLCPPQSSTTGAYTPTRRPY